MTSRAILSFLAAALSLVLAGCGGAPKAAPAAEDKGSDVCAGSPPVPHAFTGILARATCEQDMFLRMARVTDQLGVTCAHCHAPSADPKREDYPKETPNKEIANWMHTALMPALRAADGSRMQCKSCHEVDGKRVAKILGEPRDTDKAMAWMSQVLVKKFVTAKGEALTCKSCHVGSPGTPDFQGKVLLRTAQLPPR